MDPAIWVALIGGMSTIAAGFVGSIAAAKARRADLAAQRAERESQMRRDDLDRLRAIIDEQREELDWRDGEIERLRGIVRELGR